jgi:hypothetical protein
VEGEAAANAGWYQLLSQGRAYLFVKYKKIVNESARFASAVKDLYISTKKTYCLYLNGTLTEIKNWGGIKSLLAGKERDAAAFIKKEGLKGRSDEEYIKLIDWYNGLQ